ncbi:hypothetical protein AAVH_16831 [Aphelenchoides avenae]|nr:hypothetical protein AAVH_16831 [Aphelenchus avenae]
MQSACKQELCFRNECHLKRTIEIQDKLIKRMQSNNREDVTRRIQQLAKKCGVDVSRLCAENVDVMADSDCKPALQLLLDLLQLVSVERDAAVDQRDALIRSLKLKESAASHLEAHLEGLRKASATSEKKALEVLAQASRKLEKAERLLKQNGANVKRAVADISSMNATLSCKLASAERLLEQSDANWKRTVAELEDVTSANVALQKQLNAATATIEKLQDEVDCKLKCSLCTDKDIDTVFHCGHTSCSGCIDSWMLRSDKCPVCARRIGRRQEEAIQEEALPRFLMYIYELQIILEV